MDDDSDWITARYVLSSILGRNPFVVDRDDEESFLVDTPHVDSPPAAGRGSRAESSRLPTPMPAVRATEGVAGTVCTVCTEEIAVADAVVRLPCAHWYHAGCIAPWLGIRSTCPICRAELPSKGEDGQDGGVGGCEKPLARVGGTSVSGAAASVRWDASYEYPAAGSILFG